MLVSMLNSSDADSVSHVACHSVYVLVSILNSSNADCVSHVARPQVVRVCFYA